MTIKFGQMTMRQMASTSTVYDRDSGLTFHPLKIAAIEGGCLERETVQGCTILDPFGRLVLHKSERTVGPYYFRITGVNLTQNAAETTKLVDLIVPFNNLGLNASTSRLDLVG
jgi:hypothetical protein